MCSVIALPSFLFAIILNASTFMSFVSFRTDVVGNSNDDDDEMFSWYGSPTKRV